MASKWVEKDLPNCWKCGSEGRFSCPFCPKDKKTVWCENRDCGYEHAIKVHQDVYDAAFKKKK